MDDYQPQLPRIYKLMAEGKVPIWAGLTAVTLTWILVIIPALLITLPIWAPVCAYHWIRGRTQRVIK